jgi:hypothetical protein
MGMSGNGVEPKDGWMDGSKEEGRRQQNLTAADDAHFSQKVGGVCKSKRNGSRRRKPLSIPQ